MLADFKRLWATNFLDDLSIEVTDHTFPNGAVGKMVVYHMEERERIKIVDYRDTDEKSISIIKRTDIDEKLRERSIELRLDSFRDDGTIRRVEGVLRELMAEKGFTNAEVSHRVTPVAGGPKLINVTFVVGEGPSSRFVTSSSSAIKRSAMASSRRRSKRTSRRIPSTAGSPAAALQGSRVRRGRGEDRRVLPEPRLSAGACRAARSQDAREQQGRQDALDPAADPRDRR